MKLRFSIKSLLVVITIVSVVMAIAYYALHGSEIVIVTKSGAKARLYTDTVFCDRAEPIYCDLWINGNVVVERELVAYLDCADYLSTSSFVLVDADHGNLVVLFNSDIPFPEQRESAVILVYSKKEGPIDSGKLAPAIGREIVDKYFPSRNGE